MTSLGFKSCDADPDVWMRPSTNKHGMEVYEYVLLYTDDCLVISNKGEEIIRNEIRKSFAFKEESICHPNGTNYLGGKIFERDIGGAKCWSFNPQYVTETWKNVEEQLLKRVARGDERFNANIIRRIQISKAF